MGNLRPQCGQAFIQSIDLILQDCYVVCHVLVLLGVFEAIAAIGRVYALEIEVAASLAGCLAIALDLTTLAFVAEFTTSVAC